MKHLILVLFYFAFTQGISRHLYSNIQNTNMMDKKYNKQNLDFKNEINLKKVAEFSNNWTMINKISVKGNHCYVATKGTGIRVLNIEDVESPKEIGVIDFYAEDFAVLDTHIFAINFAGLKIIDINNLKNPVEAGFISEITKKFRFGKKELEKKVKPEFNCIHLSGDYLYIGDQNSYIYIYNISDPVQPVEVSTFRTEGGKINNISVIDTLAYVLSSASSAASDIIVGQGLQIYDISNPTEPIEIAFHHTTDIPMHICSDSNYVYIVGCSRPRTQAQIHIFFKGDLKSAFHPFITIEEKYTYDTELLGDYLYLATSDGIYIYNSIADRIEYLQTKDEVRSLAKSGEFLLTAVNNKLVIYRCFQNEKSQK